MFLITSMLPLKLLHLPRMVDILLLPCLGRAFFWKTSLIPVFFYFFSVLTFYSINRIFLLLGFYSCPKLSGPFSSNFKSFWSWIFCYKSCLSSWLILGLVYAFLIGLDFGAFAWILGICWGAFLILTSTTSSSD